MTNRVVLPGLSVAQVAEFASLLHSHYHLERPQILELAGRGLAEVAKKLLGEEIEDQPVVVLAGTAEKGSIGLIAARHLHNWGAWVQVLCSDAPEGFSGMAAQQLATLRAMDAPVAWAEDGWELPPSDLVIDTILGAEIDEVPAGMARNLIALANSSIAPIVSFDFPSGLDPLTGDLFAPCIRAAATVVMALPRRSLLVHPGRGVCGEIFLTDIGAPPALFGQLGIDMPPIFGQGQTVHVEMVDDREQVVIL